MVESRRASILAGAPPPVRPPENKRVEPAGVDRPSYDALISFPYSFLFTSYYFSPLIISLLFILHRGRSYSPTAFFAVLRKITEIALILARSRCGKCLENRGKQGEEGGAQSMALSDVSMNRANLANEGYSKRTVLRYRSH